VDIYTWIIPRELTARPSPNSGIQGSEWKVLANIFCTCLIPCSVSKLRGIK